MKIDVTADDIAKGTNLLPRCENCPVALAIKRATGNDDVSVAGDTAAVGYNSYRLPRVAAKFIKSFDLQFAVEPFSFELPI